MKRDTLGLCLLILSNLFLSFVIYVQEWLSETIRSYIPLVIAIGIFLAVSGGFLMRKNHSKRKYDQTIILYTLEILLYFAFFAFNVQNSNIQTIFLFTIIALKKQKLKTSGIKIFIDLKRVTLKHSKGNIVEIVYLILTLSYYVFICSNDVKIVCPILLVYYLFILKDSFVSLDE
ncbi:hypothetical protein SAMN02745116_02334 [Pilibacter termitis]|uniref:Uncharacterized protein n=1 Tax=Pilibacter termitis TaxID=263852 RepID=A0A1T4QV40_9ENTE|nr:hypothetical protein [Pilibacter termitis]SKA07650.1 hypothetical protein SAMN02745116_02334 [Pilibacter termitis]